MSRSSKKWRFQAVAIILGAIALLAVESAGVAGVSPSVAQAATRGTGKLAPRPVGMGPLFVMRRHVVLPRQVRLAARAIPRARRAALKPKDPYAKIPWRSALCSWYWEPQGLAGGGYLTPNAMIVAHKSLPFGTRVQFSYRGRTAIAVVKDRGPYVGGREFDLGPGIAKTLGFDGVATVKYRILP